MASLPASYASRMLRWPPKTIKHRNLQTLSPPSKKDTTFLINIEHDARRARRLVLRVACRRRWQNNSNHTKQTKDGQCAVVRGTAYKRLRRVAAAGGGWQPPAGHQNESGTSVAYELQAPRRRKYYLHIKNLYGTHGTYG